MTIFAGGCGSVTNASNPTATGRPAVGASYAQASNASCAIGEMNGQPVKQSCVFVLADGRRFSCPPRFARGVQTATSLERAKACRAIAPLQLSVAVRRVTAAIESAQACLTAHKVRAIGSAVLLPLAGPDSLDGELIAGDLPTVALIAFYRDVKKAFLLEPGVLRNARRVHAQVERRGAVTIFWVQPPTAALRKAVQACLPGA